MIAKHSRWSYLTEYILNLGFETLQALIGIKPILIRENDDPVSNTVH